MLSIGGVIEGRGFLFLGGRLGFFDCSDRDSQGVFAMQELQENYDAFGAVVGEDDGFKFFIVAAVYAYAVTGFKSVRFLLVLGQLLLELFDEFIGYRDRLRAERDELVDSTG